MADISKLEQQAELLMQNVMGWENSTLQRIGKRIKRYGKLSLADVESINNIATVKQDMDAITKELAKVTGYNISQIEQMYGELLEEQHLANQPLYDYRGKKFVPFAENRELQAMAKAYARTTAGNMVNLSQIGGSHLGFIDKDGKFKALEKMYTEALDKAVMQVSTGATDFHTAMRDTIVEMGGSGIRISYPDSGITRRLDTAVRQSLLWGAKQASVEYNEMIGKELGCDGIEIDYHSNPRPSHEIMQGKQYSIVGKKTINGVTYEDAYEQGVDGSGGLLNDYGCLHYKTPIILGISEPRYSEKELARLKEQDEKTYEIDGKQVTGYEATQMQRRLETAVRNEKSIKNMAQAEGNKKLVSDCNAKIKAYQTKYNEISDITGIAGDKKRMSVPRSTATVKSATPTPKIETPKISSRKEAYEHLRNNIGMSVDEDSYVKFIDERVLTENVEQLSVLNDKFGIIKKEHKCEFIGTPKKNANAYVSVDPKNLKQQSLSICADANNDYEKVVNEALKSKKTGWHMPFADKNASVYSVTHEYGHILQHSLIDKRVDWSDCAKKAEEIKKKVSSNASIQQLQNARKNIGKIYEKELIKEQKTITVEIVEEAKKIDKDFSMSKYLSEYGRTNYSEFFAEAFANSQLGEPNVLGQAMNKWLERQGF